MARIKQNEKLLKKLVEEATKTIEHDNKKLKEQNEIIEQDKRELITKNKIIEEDQIILSNKNILIAEQNRYKDAMIQEIHHRVKNNLQVVSSMVDMQLRNLKTQEEKKIFESTRQRVNNMAIIHEMLYKSNNVTEVNIRQYLTGFIEQIVKFYSDINIDLHTDIGDIQMSTDETISMCLFISEVISNSVKHAFAETISPQIDINLEYLEITHTNKLLIRDNGCGISEKAIQYQDKTMGLKLLNVFARKLSGDILISGKSGTTIELIFTRKKSPL